MNSLDKAKLCLGFIEERKTIDPIMLDVAEMTSYTDYFIFASGDSTRQVKAIAGHVREKMKKNGYKNVGIEGEAEGNWILMDYGDLIVHIFYHPIREFYDLEGIWFGSPVIPSENKKKKGDME